MFNGCINIKKIILSNFNVNKVNDMSNMFKNCLSLESIDIKNFNNSNETDIYQICLIYLVNAIH